jgi:hypothetical protein
MAPLPSRAREGVMDWTRGFITAGAVAAASVVYTAIVVAMINWLGGGGLALSLVPPFLMIAIIVAAEG